MNPLIFLIDDNELDNYVNSTILKSQEFGRRILEFLSATEALRHLSANAEDSKNIPDIIFLDLKMPLMDGFDFLSEFSKLPDSVRTKSKIIMLSSSIDKKDQERASNHPHIHKYFTKPLTKEKILKI